MTKLCKPHVLFVDINKLRCELSNKYRILDGSCDKKNLIEKRTHVV